MAGHKSEAGFWFLALFFALFVLFMYGPMLIIVVLSFQGPGGGLTFPLNGLSLHWFHQLAQGLGVVDIGAALRRSLGLGLAVSTVLVHVVNPQSFHWTMDLQVPWARLLALCAAVMLAGTLTAWLAGRAAAGKDAVLAVKEDW